MQGPLARTRAPITRCSVCCHLGTPRAPQGHATHWAEGLPGPAPLSPSYPPGCGGTQLPIRKESVLAPAGRVFQAGDISNSYFFTQVRTKISLSHPSPAAVTDITPATLVFPGPSPVTVLKSWCLQLLLLWLPLAVAEIREVLKLCLTPVSPGRSHFIVSGCGSR